MPQYVYKHAGLSIQLCYDSNEVVLFTETETKKFDVPGLKSMRPMRFEKLLEEMNRFKLKFDTDDLMEYVIRNIKRMCKGKANGNNK